MFTIKTVNKYGDEAIYAAEGVQFQTARARNEAAGPNAPAIYERASVEFYQPNGIGCSIDSGDVYVMNEAGSTVAKYHLVDGRYQHGAMPQAA